MRWRREDAGYAAATLGAVCLVAYLIVANFGLVPSPFAPADFRAPGDVGIPAFQAAPVPGGGGQLSGGDAVQVPSVPDLSGLTPGDGGPAPAPADNVPPAVAIGTPDGAILVSLGGESISGTASDDRSGIARVAVTFTPLLGEASTIVADTVCTASLTCTWTTAPPALIGSYTVEAEALDGAGNSAKAGPITITVVEAQPSASEQDGGLIGGAVDAVTGTVGAVVETAGGLLGAIL